MRAIKKIWPIVTTEKTVSIRFILFIIGSLLTSIIVTFLFGPFCSLNETCLFCGMSRHTRAQCGIIIWQQEESREISDWILPLYPDHKEHLFCYTSSFSRSRWFDHIECGDGGYGGLVGIYFLHRLGLEEDAKKWLAEWHAALKLPQEERSDRLRCIGDNVRQLWEAEREYQEQLQREERKKKDEEYWRNRKLQEKRQIEELLRKRKAAKPSNKL